MDTITPKRVVSMGTKKSKIPKIPILLLLCMETTKSIIAIIHNVTNIIVLYGIPEPKISEKYPKTVFLSIFEIQ